MKFDVPIIIKVSAIDKWKRLMENIFEADVRLFEREKGWYYVSVPMQLSKPLEYLAGRGLIAVTARIGGNEWPTSLLPMGDGTHFIALPAKVRTREKIKLGDKILVAFEPCSRE